MSACRTPWKADRTAQVARAKNEQLHWHAGRRRTMPDGILLGPDGRVVQENFEDFVELGRTAGTDAGLHDDDLGRNLSAFG